MNTIVGFNLLAAGFCCAVAFICFIEGQIDIGLINAGCVVLNISLALANGFLQD
jgi:hypothetical protein